MGWNEERETKALRTLYDEGTGDGEEGQQARRSGDWKWARYLSEIGCWLDLSYFSHYFTGEDTDQVSCLQSSPSTM